MSEIISGVTIIMIVMAVSHAGKEIIGQFRRKKLDTNFDKAREIRLKQFGRH